MAPRASQRRHYNSDGRPKFKPLRSPKHNNATISSLRRYALPALLVFAFSLVGSYFYISRHYPSSPSSDAAQDWSVYNRGLGTSDLSYKAVLSDFGSPHIDKTKRHFNNSVLAYVTPWNSKGYDMAKLFRHKLTHVSPVWYQLKCGETVELHGRHDADQKWIESVRIKGRPLILPRVTLEGWQMDTLLAQQDETKQAMNIISSECKTMRYDGVVLEAWNAWAVNGILDNPILRQKALLFVRELGFTLHRMKLPRPNRNMQLIFVIPPPSDKEDAKHFTAADIAMLGNFVDGFSLMTYDYSNPYHPGPSAPFPWLQACLHLLLGGNQKDSAHVDDPDEDDSASKVLMGLNFYGNDFMLPKGGGPIIGHEYVSLLRKHKPTLLWDEKAKEHYFEYLDGKKHLVYYPSLRSLALRLELASKWGTGISIWEIGQGLEYFFDLL